MAVRSSTIAAACCVASLTAAHPATADPDADRQVLHVLDRIAFGATRAEADYLRRVGIERYIAEQLDPASIAEPPALTRRLAPLDRLTLDSAELYKRYGPLTAEANGGVPPTQRQVDARIEDANVILEQASAARVFRALYSPRQLQEVMVDFWFNRFNIYAYKGFDLLWIGNYEAEAIRPHVLGKFRDLLLATAHHPAMVYYLDNQTSSAPGSPNAKGEFAGLNENYARELLELHTLGVDGGYTQDDVVTLARILTGWGFDYAHMDAGAGSAEGFDPTRHDGSDKLFLGRPIKGGGEEEGVAALDILASSPATAHHIAFELAQYFVADNPPPALVDRLAARFSETDGDIKAVMAALLASREFRDSVGQKYKTPYQFVLSAARAGGVEVNNPEPLLGTMARLGQQLYLCQTPDGYKNTEAEWLSPDATTLKIDFASLLASGAYLLDAPRGSNPWADRTMAGAAMPGSMGGGSTGGTRLVAERNPAAHLKPRPIDPVALHDLLAPLLSQRTRDTVAGAPQWLQAALILGSPDFMRR
ncbi:MAG: DUF1800 domain-containing protein [Alphaproteobacteria bacterium]|nr:DUF1800 domain-containing protein [Alphaproteobacteria bacterium]